MHFRGYYTLLLKAFTQQFDYSLATIFQNLFLIVQAVVAISVGLSFTHSNYTIQELALYYAFGTGIINLFQRRNFIDDIEADVESGLIVNHVAKPYNYFVFVCVKTIANKIVSLATTSVAIFLIIFALADFALPSLEQFGRALLIIPVAVALMYLVFFIFGQLCVVWEHFAWFVPIIGITSFFLGGGLIPIEFMPPIVAYFPQSFFFGHSLAFIIHGTMPLWWLFCVYLVFFIVANYVLYKFVMKRLVTNGG